MKKLILILSFSLCVIISHAQNPKDTGLVKWIDMEQALELNKKQTKPFLIDFYTDWCGWCKHMLKTTYANEGLATYINTYFYPVKFNAEGFDTINYQGVQYINPGSGKRSTHQFAVKTLGNKLVYPSTVFLANNLQFTLLTSGYLDVPKIEPILIYLVENIFRTTNFEEFETDYKKTFNQSEKNEFKFDELNSSLKDPKGKKTIIFIDAPFCNSCKVFKGQVLGDSLSSKFMHEEFNVVNIPADSRDTIRFRNTLFQRSNNDQFFHPLILALSKGSMNLPGFIFLNEKQEVIDVIPYYLSREHFNNVLKFYGSDAYLSKKFDEFILENKK